MTVVDTPPSATAAPAPAPVRLALAWLLVGLAVTGLAVALSGAGPQPVPAGLPDAGPVPAWGLPLVRLLGHAAAVALVAVLLAALLTGHRARVVHLLPATALWSAAAVTGLLLGLAEVVGRPVPDVLAPDLLRYYVREVPQGRASALTAVLALAVLLPVGPRVGGGLVRLLMVGVALVPPLLAGHAATAGSHRTAQAALIVHVAAAVLWVGGVAALALLPAGRDLSTAARRFSPLALGCVLLVVASGVVGGVLRLDVPAQLVTTGYGVLLLLKSVLLVALVVAGAAHRRRTLPALAAGAPGALRRLAGVEMVLMAAVLGLATALGRTPIG